MPLTPSYSNPSPSADEKKREQQQELQGVIKKCGEGSNKKIITVRDTLPFIPLKIYPLASNTLIPSFLPISKAVLEVLFHECL